MGTWGTAIFSDDTASDIKNDFIDKIAIGKSPASATEEIIAEYNDTVMDDNESSVFWLALSATQWTLGRLQEKVKQRALDIINGGQDLKRWEEDPKQLVQRKKVLEKLKAQLQSDQPTPKKIAVPFIRQTKMETGNLICYKHPTGKMAIFRVVNIQHDHCGDKYPQVEILNYFNQSIPDLKAIKGLQPIVVDSNPHIKSSGTYYISSLGKKDIEPWDKFKLLENKTTIPKINVGATSLIWWKNFDEFLLGIFENK